MMKTRKTTNLRKVLTMYNKIETPETYHIIEPYGLDLDFRDEEDKANHSNDLDQLIENAKNAVQEHGKDRYIVKVIRKVHAVKEPYTVEIKDMETE